MEVFVFGPKVSVGLLPNRPVPVPKEGALVVVVPKPAGLLPNRFCKNKKSIIYLKKTNINNEIKSEILHQSPVYPHSQSQRWAARRVRCWCRSQWPYWCWPCFQTDPRSARQPCSQTDPDRRKLQNGPHIRQLQNINVSAIDCESASLVHTNHAAGIGRAHGVGGTEREARVLGGGGLTEGLEETISL